MKKFNSPSEGMKIALIGAAATILAAIIVGVFTLRSISSNQPSVSPTPPPVPITSATTQSTNLATTPTPTPPVISINQTMSCTNCTDPSMYNFSLIVRNATIDPAKSQVTLLIGVQNISPTSRTGVVLTLISLQDLQTGVTTNGAGDGFSSFDIAANQLILFRPTFQFVPVVGHAYSLSAELSAEVGPPFLFSPITIKF